MLTFTTRYVILVDKRAYNYPETVIVIIHNIHRLVGIYLPIMTDMYKTGFAHSYVRAC